MTQTFTPGVIRLGEEEAHRPELTGHKAAALSRLLVRGFPVPPGFVVTPPAARLIAADGAGDPGPISEVERALAALGDGPATAFAVRSSGLAEDLAGASFAGQYESVLGARGIDEIVSAIKVCVASAATARVAAYAGDGGAAPMAVLIQPMVPADAAGVAFTANPVTGDAETVVNAVRGLGDRLVGGEVVPDGWVVRDREAVCLDSPQGAVDAAMVLRIAELAARAAEVAGVPQDVEWAIADGAIYLLQARPITALPRPPEFEIPGPGRWMKDTAHYPMPLTPFGASVYLPAIDAAFPAMGELYGLPFDGFEQRSLGGEAYGRIVPMGGKERKPPPWWVMWAVARLMPALRRKERAARAVAEGDAIERLTDRWYREWRPELVAEVRRLRETDPATLDDPSLLEHLDQAIALLRRGEEVHFLLWPGYGFRLFELATACRDLLGWEGHRMLELVAGTSTASSEPGRALASLAAAVSASPEARAAVEAVGGDVLERLRAADPGAADAFAAFVAEHGHRTMSYDPGDATLAERPELIAALVRDQIARPIDSGVSDARREAALAEARAVLAGRTETERRRFERALAAAAGTYPVREDNVIITDNLPAGLIRRAVMEIGRRLAERGVVAAAEDVVFLEEGEVRRAFAGEPGDFRAVTIRRRAERAWVIAHPGPVGYGPESPAPDLRGFPPGLRLMMEGLLWNTAEVFRAPVAAGAGEIVGVPTSAGRYTGTARLILDEAGFGRLGRGEVLVCPTTSPAWSVLLAQAGAVVTDGGSMLSHAAVIAREYGIPAVAATADATRRIPDGTLVTVDGSAGTVELHQAG